MSGAAGRAEAGGASGPAAARIPYGAIAVVFWAGLLLAWEALVHAGLAPAYLVAPSVIARTVAELSATGELWAHSVASLRRAAAGFAVGAALGVAVGLLAGVNRFVELYLDPIISATYPVPKIALLPIIMAWLGIGDASKIAIIAVAVFFPTFLNAYYGAKQTSPTHLRAARNMGAGRLLLFRRVVLPSALPQLLTGLRIGLALSFIVMFASEMIGSQDGLGFLILFAENNMRFDIMYAALVAIAVIGLAFDRALLLVRRRLLRGRPETARP